MYFNPKTTQELIQSINTANQYTGSHTITLQPQFVYELTTVQDTSEDNSGLPAITKNITFIGNGATIKRAESAQAEFRILLIEEGATVELQGLTISGGYLSTYGSHGGGITNKGTLTIKQCTIADNAAHYGGGIINDNPTYFGTPYRMTIINSTIKNNEDSYGDGSGGGILNGNGILEMDNSDIIDNKGYFGAGLGTGGSATVTNCVFSGNIASGSACMGGAVGRGDSPVPTTAQFTDCDFYNNQATHGGCIFASMYASDTILNNCRIFDNISGYYDVEKDDPYPEPVLNIDATNNWWGTADGPSGQGSGSGDSVSVYVDYDPYLTSEDPLHEGASECPICFAANDVSTSTNPISLRFGEKRQEETDIQVNTPAEVLAFTRSYRQSKQADFQFMGLGWTHNHRIYVSDPGSQQPILLYMPKGGITQFEYSETVGGKDCYPATSGSTAIMGVDPSNPDAQYTLTAMDQSIYTFDSAGKLRSRAWSSGETWTYTYDGNDNLTTVEDDYDRQLQFTYHSGHTGDDAYKNGQLWRIGDHTASGLDGSTPTGRYVELDYTPEKSDGVKVSDLALLQRVQNVRGNIWTYDYYGQDVGEDEGDFGNFLIERQSPAVDTNGDGTTDGSLILEQLQYDYELDLAVNGGMEFDSDWGNIPDFAPTINEQSSTPVDSGTCSRHVVASAANQGIEGNAWNLVAGREYTVTAMVYPVSGQVKMQVTDDTHFDIITDDPGDLGAWKLLSASYTPTESNADQRLQFIAFAGAAEFYVDTVSISETSPNLSKIVQKRGVVGSGVLEETEFVFAPGGKNITTQTVAEKTITHSFDRGLYAGTEDPSGNVQSEQPNGRFRSSGQVDANGNHTWLNWDSEGKHLERVGDALGYETIFGYDSADRLTTSTDAEGHQTGYIYDADQRQPMMIVVQDNPTEIISNGGMEDDSDWTGVLGASNYQTDIEVDSGSYAWYVNAAINAGIESSVFDLVADHTYLIMARVYPVSGTVKMLVTGTPGFDISSSGAGAWETLVAVYVPSSSSTEKLEFLADGGAAEFYVDSVQVIDSTTILRWQEFTYDAKGRTLTEKLIDPIDGVSTLNQVTRSYYNTPGNGNGLLHQVIQEDMVGSNDVTTTYTYDAAGRVVKTQTSSNFGSCNIQYTVYDDAGNVVASICNYNPGLSGDPTTAAAAAALYNPLEPDENQVTTHDYDTMGRRVQTTVNAGSDFAQTSLTFYDALGRVWRTITNYVDADPGYAAPGNWVCEGGIWKDGTGGTPIEHSTENNENIISDTAYNARGLVRLQRNVLGNVTLYGYDSADRLIKTVQNAATPGYDNDYGTGADPDLSDYPENTGSPDQDIITEQVYDPAGNLVKTIGPLGDVNFTVYNALNRSVKTVRSAGTPDYDILSDLSLSSYPFSTDPDTDLAQSTEYDALGRVFQTGQLLQKVDSTETWAYTRTVYDALGRVWRTIANYVDNGYTAPESWGWVTDHWEDDDSTIIDHGANNDQNLITETVYDSSGRVQYTLDLARAKTWSVYDGLGRQVKTIANCTYNGSGTAPDSTSYVGDLTDPAADRIIETIYDADGRIQKTRRVLKTNIVGTDLEWVWTLYGYDGLNRQVKVIQNADTPTYDQETDPDLSGYSASSDPDKDLITETVYDDQGRVQQTIDTLGRITYTVYDITGRRIRSIVNYVDDSYQSPENWVWVTDHWEDGDSNTIDHGDNDQNIITETVYDVAGRVQKTIDALRYVTFYGYDQLGRQIKVIRNASDTDHAVDTTYDLSDYTPDNPGGDQDRITTTVYDLGGRVQQTTDEVGNITFYGYDRAGRQVKVIRNASDTDHVVGTTYDLSNYTPDSPDADQDYITGSSYDKAGRQISATDAAGMETRTLYDGIQRPIRAIGNYVAQGSTDPVDWVWSTARRRWERGVSDPTAIDQGTDHDQNLISDTHYNSRGQVEVTRDGRGTQTGFTYDAAGRRQTVTADQDGALETIAYTVYDKAGRLLRQIRNWLDDGTNPDARVSGDWLFNPSNHGPNRDLNLITEYSYDQAGRRTTVTDPVGNATTTTYFKDGQVNIVTDPENTPTLFRYDGLRRRNRVVQNYVATDGINPYSDPAGWVWSTGHWEDSSPTPVTIQHGDDNDENSIVQASHDLAGRMTSLRDPRGQETIYTYDRLGRRTSLTNPLSNTWATTYANIESGGVPTGETRQTLIYPGLETGGSYPVVRDFDRLGRLKSIDYNAAATTPQVSFAYDAVGNRTQMTENDDTQTIRITNYAYDAARRLTGVGFDTDGDSSVDETVSYEYDVAGHRTKMTLPGGLDIEYLYDAKGRLVSLRDWDNQVSDFVYDGADRQIATVRDNGLLTEYRHDAAGHLERLRHLTGSRVNSQFLYTVDGRGNRTQVVEYLAQPSTVTATYTKSDTTNVSYYPQESWSDSGDFKESTDFGAVAAVVFTGDELTLTFGVGPDHSIFDVYIGGSLWQSFDGYAETSGERTVYVALSKSVTDTLEIRNRPERNLANDIEPPVYRVQFKQLQVLSTSYNEQTIQYTYDGLSRLLEADYDSGTTVYTYGYDRAGNLVDMDGVTRTYNAANQMTYDGTNYLDYDDNGNLTSDGVNSYTWDRANRMLTAPGSTSYQYDGLGNRIQQTVSSVVTDYLLDTQPGLTKVLAQTTSGNTDRFVHGSHGIHAMEDNSGSWTWPVQDGLGSVRGVVSDTLAVNGLQHYTPYGDSFGTQGSLGMNFGFTGEQTDANGQVYLRARYYNPSMGMFPSRDPFEGMMDRPMSLNGYLYVEGAPMNNVDPSGMIVWNQALNFKIINDVPFGEFPIVQGDCITCVAREGGVFNANANPMAANDTYLQFLDLIVAANENRGVLYRPDREKNPKDWRLLPFSNEGQQNTLLVPTLMKFDDCSTLDLLINGITNQGRCLCQNQCPPGAVCDPPPVTKGCDILRDVYFDYGKKIRSVGSILPSVAVGFGPAGGLGAFVMWDANDVGSNNYVVYVYRELGVGVLVDTLDYVEINNLAKLLLSQPIPVKLASEASLDEISGHGVNFSLDIAVYELQRGFSLSRDTCYPTTDGGAVNFSLGAKITETKTDMLYDARTNTWAPEGEIFFLNWRKRGIQKTRTGDFPYYP